MAKKSSKKATRKRKEEELQPEVWDVRHSYGSKQNDRPKCMGESCSELAIACWFSNLNPDEPWNCCEKCQKEDFGGWPPNFARNEDSENANADEKASDETNTATSDEVTSESDEGSKATVESAETQNHQLLASETTGSGEENDFNNGAKKNNHDTPNKDGEQVIKDGNQGVNDKPGQEKAEEEEGPNLANVKDQTEGSVKSTDQNDEAVEKIKKNEESDTSGTDDMPTEDVLPDVKHEEVKNNPLKKQKKSNQDEGVPEITQEEIPEVSQEDDEEQELWNLTKLFSIKDLKSKRALKCNTEDCNLLACVTYTSNFAEEWNTCLDCQQLDYGGWPPIDEMPKECLSITEEHKAILAKVGSKVNNPEMPPSNNLSGEKHASSEENSNTSSKKQKIEGDEEKVEEEGEFWTLTKLFTIAELRSKNALHCETEDCNLFSCVTYTSSLDGSKWNSCLDCQKNDYGGWPDIREMPKECFSMTDEHKDVLRKLCSVEDDPEMPQTIIDETETTIDLKEEENVRTTNASLTPPKSTKEINIKSKQPSVITPPPPKQPSAQALKLHRKWQEAAEALGGKGVRIVVAKDEAKQIIFDMLKDSFKPMNITDIYKSLKAIVPSPVLKSCLDDMTYDDLGNPFDDDSDDEGTKNKAASKEKNVVSDPFASSLFLKAGRNNNTALYFVDYNKLANNGNGLLPDERDELITSSQSTSIEEQNLKRELKKIEDLTKKLLSEPTNEEASIELESKESEMAVLEEKLDSLRVYAVNENTRKKINKRIDELTSVWRKRRRICRDFLITMEDCTEGTISMKKCLAGDGQMYLEDDDYAIREARLAAKAKSRHKLGGKKTIKLLSKNVSSNESNKSQMNHTESFVGVKLDNSGNISRVHLDEE